MGLKQPFNAISHMVGGGLAIAGAPLLIARAEGMLALFTVSLYLVGLVALYTLSSLFHAVPSSRRGELWLERLDHVGIYLLIAGTYSPVSLLFVGDLLGWILFILAWGLAAVGITLALTVPLGPKWVHIIGYIVLGWAALIAAPVLVVRLDPGGLFLLIGGGVLYSSGAFLYVRDRAALLGPFGDHEVWHVLVLAASAMHYALVLGYIL